MCTHLKRIVSMFLSIALITIMSPTFAFASSADSEIDAVLAKINAEYGTNIRVVTPEEALEKYGMSLDKAPTSTTKQELSNLEDELRQIALTEIPQFEITSQKALEKMKENGISFEDLKTVTGSSNVVTPAAASTLVTAAESIDYAIAMADIYIVEDAFGNTRWGVVERAYCYSVLTWERSYVAGTISTTIIDLGRTCYWQANGDYMAYINGTLYYIGSGYQYAEMYVGNYV